MQTPDASGALSDPGVGPAQEGFDVDAIQAPPGPKRVLCFWAEENLPRVEQFGPAYRHVYDPRHEDYAEELNAIPGRVRGYRPFAEVWDCLVDTSDAPDALTRRGLDGRRADDTSNAKRSS